MPGNCIDFSMNYFTGVTITDFNLNNSFPFCNGLISMVNNPGLENVMVATVAVIALSFPFAGKFRVQAPVYKHVELSLPEPLTFGFSVVEELLSHISSIVCEKRALHKACTKRRRRDCSFLIAGIFIFKECFPFR